MNESSSWASFKQALQTEAASRSYSVHIVRVESLVGLGIFDCCLCYRGVTVWLEGKFLLKFPLKEGTLVKVGFSDYQELFATRRLLAGGLSFLWCHVGMNNDGSRVDGSKKKVREGMIVAGTAAKGWYLVELCSLDLIRSAKVGFEQGFMGSCWSDSPKRLAGRLLDKLDLIKERL